MSDPGEYRAASRARWEAAAAGWETRRADLQRAARPVSEWLVEAIDPRPGQIVLELAAGLGETGFLAAERLRPGGTLLCTDGAEPMVDAARRRAAELGLDDVEFAVMEAEWIDRPTASVDGVLCRWGYMLLADPEAALRETRRVLRPGGRVALAAWAAPEANPWATAAGHELRAHGLAEAADPDTPGMFAFARHGVAEELLWSAGFADVRTATIDIVYEAPSFDEWWEYLFDVSPSLAEGLAGATPEQRDAVHDGVGRRLAEYADAGGRLRIPGRALVAAASA